MRKLALVITNCLVIFNLLADRIQSQTTVQQEKTEAVKIRSTEVLVDAVVVDHRNRLIGDLTAQDFEIFEDGVPQRLDSFRVIRGGLEKPGIADRKSPKGSDVQPNGESKSPAIQSTLPNLTILLLDYSTTKFENQKLIQKASIKFVEERMLPKDFMAVFILCSWLRLLTAFTSD